MQIAEQLDIKLTGQIEIEEGMYLSHCEELPIVGVGYSPQEAMNSFTRCLMDYFHYNGEWGMLGGILEEKGLTTPCPEEIESCGRFTMNLPIPADKVPANEGRGRKVPV